MGEGCARGVQLDLETLDVNPYLGAAGRPSGGQAAPAPSAGGPSQPGWDDAPIDFSALNALNADLALNVGQLVYKDIKAGPVAITAKIDGSGSRPEPPIAIGSPGWLFTTIAAP